MPNHALFALSPMAAVEQRQQPEPQGGPFNWRKLAQQQPTVPTRRLRRKTSADEAFEVQRDTVLKEVAELDTADPDKKFLDSNAGSVPGSSCSGDANNEPVRHETVEPKVESLALVIQSLTAANPRIPAVVQADDGASWSGWSRSIGVSGGEFKAEFGCG